MPTFSYPKNQFHPAQIPAMHRLLTLSKAKKVVEVGSWLGESTSIIADFIKPEGRVYVVDWFKGSPDTDLESIAQETDIYKIFDSNLKELNLRQYVHPFIMESHKAVDFIKDSSIDLVFIDACHKYESVKRDISSWMPKLRNGGIICGHDCESKEWDERYIHQDVYEHKHHGVIKAVNEFFKGDFNIDERIWWACKS